MVGLSAILHTAKSTITVTMPNFMHMQTCILWVEKNEVNMLSNVLATATQLTLTNIITTCTVVYNDIKHYCLFLFVVSGRHIAS